MRNTDFGPTILITIVVVLLVFLVLREVVCWYWKINRNIALLTEIRDLLRPQATRQVAASSPPSEKQSPGAKSSDTRLSCPSCNGAVQANDSFCGNCGNKLR